jgi:hypothetical protein
VLNAQPCKYDMYKSSLRHIHDPVLSSLKMKGIRFFFTLAQEMDKNRRMEGSSVEIITRSGNCQNLLLKFPNI